MPRYVPLTDRERQMLRRFVNDCPTYQDKVDAVNLIDAYDNADDHDPIAQWRRQREADLRAINGEWKTGASPSFSDPGDGYDSAIRWHADFERGNL